MIKDIDGDATLPKTSGLLLHICNNKGLWNKGFVLAINNRFGMVCRNHYINCYKKGFVKLGMCLPQYMNNDLTIVHMIAQNGLRSKLNPVPFNMEAFKTCLIKIKDKYPGVDVHMPKVGSGLGGGNWVEIREAIDQILDDRDVYIYHYGEK